MLDLHDLQWQQLEHERRYKLAVDFTGQLRPHSLKHVVVKLAQLPIALERHEIELDKLKLGVSLPLKPFAAIVAEQGLVWLLRGANELNIDLAVRATTMPVQDHFRKQIAIYNGRMSKAIEALDHLEDYPSRRVLEESVIGMTTALIAEADHRGADLTTAMKRLWAREAAQCPVRPEARLQLLAVNDR